MHGDLKSHSKKHGDLCFTKFWAKKILRTFLGSKTRIFLKKTSKLFKIVSFFIRYRHFYLSYQTYQSFMELWQPQVPQTGIVDPKKVRSKKSAKNLEKRRSPRFSERIFKSLCKKLETGNFFFFFNIFAYLTSDRKVL